VQLVNNADGDPVEISLIAKNGDPGVYGAFGLASDDITAGEVAPAPSPEPSSMIIGGLALLALGARGLKELRRRRQATKAN
jgi:hypothetical protein